ncbi:MAG: hotdog domain-containing protein [Myxococcota bacterium]
MSVDYEVLERINRSFNAQIPYNAWLGLEAIDHGPARAVMRLPKAAHHIGDPTRRVIHGGVITAAMDATAGASVFLALREPRRIATLDLRIDYLRPATAAHDVISEVSCYHVTHQVAFARGVAYHEDPSEPIASCAGTFMVFPNVVSPLMEIAKAPLPDVAVPEVSVDPSLDVGERIAEAREEGDPASFVSAIPYMQAMGMEMRRDADGLLGVLPFGEHLIGNYVVRALHGGTLGSLLESTAAMEVLWRGESQGIPRIVNITVEYLRSAKAADTFARATITKAGRRVTAVRAVAWQDNEDKPVAAANLQFLTAE